VYIKGKGKREKRVAEDEEVMIGRPYRIGGGLGLSLPAQSRPCAGRKNEYGAEETAGKKKAFCRSRKAGGGEGYWYGPSYKRRFPRTETFL